MLPSGASSHTYTMLMEAKCSPLGVGESFTRKGVELLFVGHRFSSGRSGEVMDHDSICMVCVYFGATLGSLCIDVLDGGHSRYLPPWGTHGRNA